MARLKLGILACTIYFSMTAFSQTATSLRSKILALDYYQDAPQLWKLYNDSSSMMNEVTWLHTKVSLNYYFSRPDEMSQCVDSLLTLYPEECIPEQKLTYCYTKTRKLLEKGNCRQLSSRWQTLRKDKELCQAIEGEGNFLYSEKIIQGLSEENNFRVDFLGTSCTLSTSYTYPLILSMTINEVKLPNTVFDTGTSYTFLTQEMARKYNVTCMGDTISVDGTFDTSQATTGFVEILQLGNIIFHSTVVHVSLVERDPIFSSHDAILGIKELRGVSEIELEFSKLTFRKEEQRQPIDPDICLAEAGCVFLFANNRSYLSDTGGEGNFIHTPDTASVKVMDVNDCPMQFFDTYTVDSITKQSGLSGFPSFYGFETCILNFDRMNFSGKDYQLRKNYSEYINSRDIMGLDAQYERIEETADKIGRWLTNAFIEFMKNNPESYIRYTDNLLDKYQQRLGGSILSILNLRAASLTYLGMYKEAGELMKICARAVPDIINGCNEYVALEPFGTQRLAWTKLEVSISTILGEEGLLVRGKIDEIKSKLYFAPGHSFPGISEADIWKLRVEIIEFGDSTGRGGKKRIAITDELRLGDLLINNVQFDIAEETEIVLGDTFIRLLPQFSVENQRIILVQHPQTYPSTKQYPLLLVNYTFCFRDPDGNTKRCSIGNPTPNAQQIPLQELSRANKKVVFDVEHTKLSELNKIQKVGVCSITDRK